MHSIEDAQEGNVRSTEAAMPRCFTFRRLSGGVLVAVMSAFMLLVMAGCGNGEVQQENQQDPVQDKDRCPLRC